MHFDTPALIVIAAATVLFWIVRSKRSAEIGTPWFRLRIGEEDKPPLAVVADNAQKKDA